MSSAVVGGPVIDTVHTIGAYNPAISPCEEVHFDRKPTPIPASETIAAHGNIEEEPSTGTPDILTMTTVEAASEAASGAVSDTKSLCSPIKNAVSRVNVWVSPFLDKLSKFNIVNWIFQILYEEVAWTILCVVAYKPIADQINLDDSIKSLLGKMDEVYTFLTREEFRRIESMQTIVERVAHQTLECSSFIQDYSKDKRFWKRLFKNIFCGTGSRVEYFNNVFDELMQEFRDNTMEDTSVIDQIWDPPIELPEDSALTDTVPHAAGIMDLSNNGDEDTRVQASSQGFFTASRQTQLSHCELNQVQGHQFTTIYVNAESKWTVLTWTQLLVSTPPGALIVGHGGLHCVQKLNHYLSNDLKPEPRNNIELLYTSHCLHVRNFTGFINVLVLFYLVFRKLVVRHL